MGSRAVATAVVRSLTLIAILVFVANITIERGLTMQLSFKNAYKSTGDWKEREGKNDGDIEGRRRMPPFNSSLSQSSSINSIPGTTGSGVPAAIRKILQGTSKPINEESKTSYGSQEAVDALEERCGWDPSSSSLREQDCLNNLHLDRSSPNLRVAPDLIDIVTPSIRNLDFLEEWREFFQGYHIIIVQDGDPSVNLKIPDWVDYELYNRNDIKKALGDKEWIISSRDASIRNFGFLVSSKPYIYTIDDDCLPAKDRDGYLINPLAIHLQNLQAPSTPYFFNTLYDPYNSESDFVRGYPYSLRNGVPTVISHGLWMHAPDYDAPTQLLKTDERNTNMLDAAVTIPSGIFYPMCSMNVAFDRKLIGPAFMQGLMGDGQPWARYDDMFAGWASKAVSDHLGVGVKSGKPYIRHNKASNPFTNLKKEYKGLWWQEEIIRFFNDELVLSKEANTPQLAYVELANALELRFSTTHEYFNRLATAMRIWVDVWNGVEEGSIQFSPSRMAENGVRDRYKPMNIGVKSHYRHIENVRSDESSVKQVLNLYEYWGPDKGQRLVTDEDISKGHNWKTYIYPLSNNFHRDMLERYGNFGCLDRACPTEQMANLPFQQVDYAAEVIILRKLLASLDFVSDPAEADLMLVPMLGVTSLWYHTADGSTKGCRNKGSCISGNMIKELKEQLKYLNVDKGLNQRKKHLFLASQDYTENNEFFRQMERSNHSRVVSLGPGNLVVPSPNPDDRLQPRNWKAPLSLEERDIFVHAVFGVRYSDRTVASKQLKQYNGNKTVVTTISRFINSREFSVHMRSIFVLCLTGDLPFQKRIFDTWASVAIPVVVLRQFDYGPSYFGRDLNIFEGVFPSLNLSYPKLPEGVSYENLVVEIAPEVIHENRLMAHLESIPKSVIETKLRNIEKVRTWFLYDFDGLTKDAFSILLENVEAWVTSKD